MRSPAFHRSTCRLCNSKRVELAVPIKPSPIADAYVPREKLSEPQPLFPLDLYLCRDCGHVQLLDVVDPSVLFRDYIYTTSISLGLVEHFRKYADEMAARFKLQPKSLAIDIGSNDGTLLRFFQNKGLRVLGIDPAERIAREATASGVETLNAFFSQERAKQIRESKGQAALITANNVFAHSDTLADMAEGIRNLLAPDGVFIFEVSYLVDIIEKLLFDTVYHEHLCYHSVKPLEAFFRSHGLELFDVQRFGGKGGSIRGFVQLQGGPQPRVPIVSELLSLESRMGLAEPELFRNFTAHLESIKSELLAAITKIKAQGKKIAGYGASATVTTLVYNFELGKYLDFLVDDNASRHGLFSPGYHIPVLPPAALAERKPDCLIILAWQYAEPILKKNQTYLDQGRRFILPMPSVKIIDRAPA